MKAFFHGAAPACTLAAAMPAAGAPRDRGGAMSADVRTAAAHVRSAKLAQPFRAPLHPSGGCASTQTKVKTCARSW